MSQSETIKEFLIGIGFKLDESSERKFSDSIARATKFAVGLGAAVEAAALAVGVGVQKMAVNFDQLYYASQRIGASAADIKAFSYAVSQMGGSAEGAMHSLENLARKMRENPGYAKQIEQQTGARIRDGKLTLQNLEDIGAYFRKMQAAGKYYNALRFAEMWGIDEPTMRAMMAGVGKFANEYKAKMKAAGLDPEKAAQDSRRFMEAWRSIFATLGNVVNSALAKIMGGGGTDGLMSLSTWFDRHAESIAKALHNLADGFMAAFRGWEQGMGKVDWHSVGNAIGQITKFFGQLIVSIGEAIIWFDKATRALVGDHGWVPALEILALVLAVKVLPRLGLLLTQLTGLGALRLAPWLLALLGIGAAAYGAAGMPFNETPEKQAARNNLERSHNPGGSSAEQDKALKERLASGEGAKDTMLSRASRWWGKKMPTWLGGGEATSAPTPGAQGTYRPAYRVGDADLSDDVVNTIAGEARMKDPNSVDAVINNMFNRLGTRAYGPSGDLRQVARAPGQYEGYRRATAKEAAYIRERIKAIASGAVPDNTSGANEFRASWYRGPWYRKNPQARDVGGNRFAYNPKAGKGPYAPYDKPRAPEKPQQPEQGRSPPYTQSGPASEDHNWDNRPRYDYKNGGKLIEPQKPQPNPFGGLNPNGFRTAPLGPGVVNSWTNPTTNNNVNQKVEIKIDGSSDPHATGEIVGKQMKRSNSDLLRNLQGAAN